MKVLEFISHIRKDADGNIIAYQSNDVAKGCQQYNELAVLLTDNQWIEETFETVTSCHALKMLAGDGKKRLTDVATTKQLSRIIRHESQIRNRQQKKGNFRCPECFHNGIILIVNCFKCIFEWHKGRVIFITSK